MTKADLERANKLAREIETLDKDLGVLEEIYNKIKSEPITSLKITFDIASGGFNNFCSNFIVINDSRKNLIIFLTLELENYRTTLENLRERYAEL